MTDTNEPQYVYGMIVLNNGDKFRARKDVETGKVSFMAHGGKQNASKKQTKSFQEGYDSAVPASSKYRFPDEYLNENATHTSSKDAAWKLH